MIRFGADRIAVDEDEALNLTAMVDVVFTLLAFFVITVRFTQIEQDLSVGAAEPAAGQAQAEDFPANVVVELWPAGDAVAIQLGQRRLADGAFADITAQLRAMDVPELPVVIAADAQLPVGAVAAAVDAVLASPNHQLSLAPRERAVE